MKTHIVILSLFLLIWSLATAAPAFATDISYCGRHDLDSVFWNTETKIPAGIVGTKWSEVEKNVGSYFDRLIVRNSTISVIKTTDSVERTLAAHPKSLYINVIFSYAPKESFTSTLNEDALVIWVETTRNEPNKDYNGSIPSKAVTRGVLFPLSKDHASFEGKPVTFGNPFFYGPGDLLTLVSCHVLEASTDNICTDILEPAKNKIVPRTTPCKRAPPISPEEKDVGKIYRRLQQ